MKRLLPFRWLISLLLTSAAHIALCDPRADLASPSQEARDAAAKILRATYKPLPRKQWDKVFKWLQLGDTEDTVKEKLRPFHVKESLLVLGGNEFTYPKIYDLDDLWAIECNYNGFGRLVSKTLYADTKYCWLDPPEHFTGLWTLYYINGQPIAEIQCKDGKCFGAYTEFYDNGVKRQVHHCGVAGYEGEQIDYYPSGKVSCRGNWKANKPVGIWTYYNENGTVERKTDSPFMK